MEMEEGRQALRGYDFVQEDDKWFSRTKRNRTQMWQETTIGWLRFDPDNGSWIPVPYKLKPAFEGVGGLDYNNPEHITMFDWEWPTDYVAQMYNEAREAAKAYAEERQLAKNPAIVAQAEAKAQQVMDEVTQIIETHPQPDKPNESKSFFDKLLGR